MSRALSLILLVAWSSAARADKDVRQLFTDANAAFAVGEFNNAAELYQQAYKLKQDPALLYDAAQAYRLAGNSERALVLYKNYLMFHPHQKNADEVRAQIEKLKEALAAQEQAKTAPPISTVAPNGGSESAEPPRPAETSAQTSAPTQEAAPAPAVAVVSTTPADRKTPVYKKWWLWTAVGAVVVAAVVVGVVVGTSSSSPWNTAPPIGPGRSQAVLSW
jgi:tetratricopeptide (TPR) repeat protein